MRTGRRAFCFAFLLLLLCGCANGKAAITRSAETQPPRVTETPVSVRELPQEPSPSPVPSPTPEPAPTQTPEPTPEITESTQEPGTEEEASETEEYIYILNTNTKKFHFPSCGSVGKMKETNRQEYTGSREELIEQGYSPCGNCKP